MQAGPIVHRRGGCSHWAKTGRLGLADLGREEMEGELGLGAWDLETGHAGAGPSQRRGSAGCLVREAGDGGWRCGMQGMAATSCDEWMDEGDGSGAKEVEEGRGEAGATRVHTGARREDACEELGAAELAAGEARGGEAEKAAGSWKKMVAA